MVLSKLDRETALITRDVMVFSDDDKAIILHYHKKGKKAYQIWKENREKNWTKNSVCCLIQRYVEHGTMDRKKAPVAQLLQQHLKTKKLFKK